MHILVLTTFLGTGCTGDAPDNPEPPGDLQPPTTPTDTPTNTPPTDTIPWPELFDLDHLLTVEIDLAPEDWDTLRVEIRGTIFELLAGDCLSSPFPSPFTWFEADVRVDDEALDSVGVRKKGLVGSMSETKPSLKIDTDRFLDGQEFPDGTEHITLNNENQDPSLIHACMAYHVFTEAGLAAPRCNFATVAVNDEPRGVYAHVEAVKKAFLSRHYDSNDGDLYEGTLSDFTAGYIGSFDVKTDESDPDLGPILAIEAALSLPDDALLPALQAVLDLDQFIRFWAVETLVGHWDGYAGNQNNFYIYRDPTTDLVTFLPWGADAVFDGAADLPLAFENGWLAARLWHHPDTRSQYLAQMEDLLDTVWDEASLHAEIDRMEAVIGDAPLNPSGYAVGLDTVRTFVDERRALLEAQLAAVPPVSVAIPPGSLCLTPNGSVSATFDTVWDSLADDPFALGYAGSVAGDTVPPLPFGAAVAGIDVYSGAPVFVSLGVSGDFDELYQVTAVLYTLDLQPGVPYDLNLVSGVGYLYSADLTDPYDEGTWLGYIDGTIEFTEVGLFPGAAVSGTISGELLGP